MMQCFNKKPNSGDGNGFNFQPESKPKSVSDPSAREAAEHSEPEPPDLHDPDQPQIYEREAEAGLTEQNGTSSPGYIVIDTEKGVIMECPMCKKPAFKDGENSEFFCAKCARAMFYPARLRLAQVLVEKEELKRAVDVIRDPTAPRDHVDPEMLRLGEHWQRMWKEAEEQYQRDEEDIERREKIAEIEAEIQTKKEYAQKLRDRNTSRQAALDAAVQSEIEPRKAEIAAARELMAKLQLQHGKIRSKTVDTKATLCREAASLLKLKHHKRKTKDGNVKDCYSVAGLWLPDLRDVNNMRCTELTAVLASTAHLLMVVSFYLSIRLPAEIIPPHRDFPLPCINTPDKSYLYEFRHVPFPGSGATLSVPASPASSRGSADPLATWRPRPLFCGSDESSETVSQFSKREPAAFNFFIEAVALLAFNIAFLSRTQGFFSGTESWEEIADIGRMLYVLLLEKPSNPNITRIASGREIRRRSHSEEAPGPSASPAPSARLGCNSDSDPLRGWKMNKYTTVSDPLRKHLLTEMNNAEWEVLDEAEWDDGGERMDDAVVVGGKAEEGKGKSGWTKVKPREKQ